MKVLLIEPFYGGSHRQLVDLLCNIDKENCCLFTLPAKKWHWRARASAIHFAQIIPSGENYTVLFCSSVLNLAELIALRPDLQPLKKVIYFHENQLVYPVRKHQERDFQYGYNQILSGLVADTVLFNSHFNMHSFLDNISSFFHVMPDCRPKGISEKLRPKCQVLYFPIEFPDKTFFDLGVRASRVDRSSQETTMDSSGVTTMDSSGVTLADVDADTLMKCTPAVEQSRNASDSELRLTDNSDSGHQRFHVQPSSDESIEPLHIIWPHRWEHDKDPETFLRVMYRLKAEGVDFRLSIVGETYRDVLPEFSEAKVRLADQIVNWGYLESRDEYHRALIGADVVVSTALHEFFGVAMLEAVHLGCYPLCPQRLVYPEIFPGECLYKTETQLLKRLKAMCRNPSKLRNNSFKMDLQKYSWSLLKSSYASHLGLVATDLTNT